jgi:hypothetical protein
MIKFPDHIVPLLINLILPRVFCIHSTKFFR